MELKNPVFYRFSVFFAWKWSFPRRSRNAMWRKRGKDSLPILPFLPCLLSKNSHFCATASQNGGVNRNRQIGQICAINYGIRGIYRNKNLIQSRNLFAVKSISNLVQRLARYRSVALISIGRLCTDMTIQFSFWSNLWLRSVSFSDHLAYIVKLCIPHPFNSIVFPKSWPFFKTKPEYSK